MCSYWQASEKGLLTCCCPACYPSPSRSYSSRKGGIRKQISRRYCCRRCHQSAGGTTWPRSRPTELGPVPLCDARDHYRWALMRGYGSSWTNCRIRLELRPRRLHRLCRYLPILRAERLAHNFRRKNGFRSRNHRLRDTNRYLLQQNPMGSSTLRSP